MIRATAVPIFLLCLLAVPPGCTQKDAPAPQEEKDKTEASSVKTFERGPLKATIAWSPEKPTLLDMIEVVVDATIHSDYALTMPAFGEGLAAFAIRDYRVEKNEAGDDSIRHRHIYQVDTFLSGDYDLTPMLFTFIKKAEKTESPEDAVKPAEPSDPPDPPDADKDTQYKLKTEAITITIHPLPEEDAITAEDFVPPYGPENLPTPPSTLLWYILGGTALAILLGIAGFHFLRHRVKKVFTPPPRPAHEIAFLALRQLIDENLPGQGKIKAFYFRLTFIVRDYIERRFRLHAPEMTTEEFLPLAATSGVLTAAHQALLEQFLIQSDLIKYAKQPATAEDIENNFNTARQFINETKETAQPPAVQTTEAQPQAAQEGGGHAAS